MSGDQKMVLIRAIVEEHAYRLWKESGDPYPTSWCSNATGPGTTIVDETAFLENPRSVEIVKSITPTIYIRCDFEIPAESATPERLARFGFFNGRPQRR